MTAAVVTDGVAAEVAALSTAVSKLAEFPLPTLSDDGVLDVWRKVESARRRLEALDQVLVAEAASRGLAGRWVMRGTQQVVGAVLRLSPAEAGVRVRHADWLGPRVAVSGEWLEPLLPAAAAARARGELTARQVEIIIDTVKTLRSSAQVACDDVTSAEQFLVEQANSLDAGALAQVARRLIDTMDPDGSLADEQAQRQRRQLSVTPSAHGMHRLSGDLDAETAALAIAVLGSLSAPTPGVDPLNGSISAELRAGARGSTSADDDDGTSDPATAPVGERDTRTAGQRRHDALRSVLKMALRAGQLPASGGIPATVLITMTAEQFETRTGLASTSFGQQLTVNQALRAADEASVAWVVHNSSGGILNYGRTRRIASPGQTLALAARDRGCSFPGCQQPPEWTERHHVTPWQAGGATNLDNLCLLCDHHHDRIDPGGWRITMAGGIPWFIPPPHIDPERRPQRNIRP